jgi:hypothetical protein
MHHEDTECEDIQWIHLTQNKVWCWPLVGMVMSLQVLYKVENFLTRS